MDDISVIMPAKNAAGTIETAMRSVLLQPHLLELIVIINGSTDDTADIVAGIGDERVRLLRAEGYIEAINAGYAAAHGVFVARCDADDVYVQDRLGWQHDWLEAHPDYIAISSGYRSANSSGVPVADLACDGIGRDVTEPLLNGRPVTHHCTWLTRLSAVQAIGGARTWFYTAHDLDMQFRLAEQGAIWHEPVSGYVYRLHDASHVHANPDELVSFYGRNARAFARQRRERGSDDLRDGHPPVFRPNIDQTGRRSAPRQVAGHSEAQAWRVFADGKSAQAIAILARSLKQTPFSARKWRDMASMLLKSAGRLPRG